MDSNGPVDELYALRQRLTRLHDTDGLSWREIATRREFRGVSHATLRDIAAGRDPSPRTRRRLGLGARRVRLAADVSAEQRKTLQDWSRRCGFDSWSAYCQWFADVLAGRAEI